MTARTSTTPVIMNRTDESRLSSVSPEEMDWMTMIPRSAEKAVPRPPNRLAPPITAAAIAFRFVSPPPELWFAAARRDAARMPPTAARLDHSMNTDR